MTVDPRAAGGFTEGVDDYERARPAYPVAVIDELREVSALGSGSTVLDLAAGTGKLTALLVAQLPEFLVL